MATKAVTYAQFIKQNSEMVLVNRTGCQGVFHLIDGGIRYDEEAFVYGGFQGPYCAGRAPELQDDPRDCALFRNCKIHFMMTW